jgi:hypothetical protein
MNDVLAQATPSCPFQGRPLSCVAVRKHCPTVINFLDTRIMAKRDLREDEDEETTSFSKHTHLQTCQESFYVSPAEKPAYQLLPNVFFPHAG